MYGIIIYSEIEIKLKLNRNLFSLQEQGRFFFLENLFSEFGVSSVMEPNTQHLDPDPGIRHNLDSHNDDTYLSNVM